MNLERRDSVAGAYFRKHALVLRRMKTDRIYARENRCISDSKMRDRHDHCWTWTTTYLDAHASERRTQVKRAADPSRERVSSRLPLVRVRRRSGLLGLGRVASPSRSVRSSARADAADHESGRDDVFSSKESGVRPACARQLMLISSSLPSCFVACYNSL